MVAGARVILKSSLLICLASDAGCQQGPQLGWTSSKWPPCLALASSQHGGWVLRVHVPREPDRCYIALCCHMWDVTQPHCHCSVLVGAHPESQPICKRRGLRLHLLMGRMSRNLQTPFKVSAQGFPEPLQCPKTTGHPTHHPMSPCPVHLLSTPNPTLNPHKRQSRDSRCLHTCTYSLKMYLEQNLNPLPKVNPLLSLPP